MIVYADVLFAVNMLMDITIIWAAGMLLKERIKISGIILGGAAGALMYIIVLYMPYINGLVQMAVTLLCIALSLTIAYKPKNIFRLIKLLVVSVMLAFGLAGIILAILCLNTYYVPGAAGYIFNNFSYGILVFSSLAIYISIKVGRNYIRKTVLDKKEYLDIKIFMEDREVLVRALQDTGNSLSDSLCGHDIIVAEYEGMQALFPEIEGLGGDGVDMFNELANTRLNTRLRLIPFKSIGNPNGMLLGIRADYAEVEISRGQSLRRENIILAIYKGNLDSTGTFNAVVSHELLRRNVCD
ncbi:sporulation sigma-E factor-processing peptidase [Clostridiales bacterium]|nr:sporulation sigma-E factor-processing peptidase [Clostridiales bacterium]